MTQAGTVKRTKHQQRFEVMFVVISYIFPVSNIFIFSHAMHITTFTLLTWYEKSVKYKSNVCCVPGQTCVTAEF